MTCNGRDTIAGFRAGFWTPQISIPLDHERNHAVLLRNVFCFFVLYRSNMSDVSSSSLQNTTQKCLLMKSKEGEWQLKAGIHVSLYVSWSLSFLLPSFLLLGWHSWMGQSFAWSYYSPEPPFLSTLINGIETKERNGYSITDYCFRFEL